MGKTESLDRLTRTIYFKGYSDGSSGLTSKARNITDRYYSRRGSIGHDASKELARIINSVADKSLIDTGREGQDLILKRNSITTSF